MDKLMSTRTTGKRIAVAAAGAVMLLTTSLPAFAARPTGSGTSTNQGSNACERISKLAVMMQSRLDDERGKLLARRDERTSKLADRRAGEQARLADRRDKWESHWEDLIGRLEANGATNTAAIAAFKTAMEAAWKARNAAIDAADKAFRDGLDKLIADKKTAVENASLAFKTAASAAFSKAKADCASGVSATTVMANLRSALKAAQDKFKSDRQSIDKIGDKVKALVTARQAAVEKAKADFKAAAEKARADLKAALGSTKSATGTKESEDHGDEDKSATEGQE